MMENPSVISAILGITGMALGYPAIKYLWPVIRDSLTAQGSQWRAENKYIIQIQKDLQKANEDRDAAREQANQLIIQVAKLEARVEIMSAQLEAAHVKMEAMMQEFRTRGKLDV